MKALSFATLLVTAAALQGAPVMRDAVTHEDLTLLYRKAMNQDPMQKQVPAKGPDPSRVSPPPSLIGSSDILCFNGLATLVPKQAILQIPKGMKDRIGYQPGAKLHSWAQFYALNRGWITTVEVNRDQSEGKEPIAEQTQNLMSKSGNLIVATFQAGPISVLPPKAVNETTAKISQP